MNHIATQVYPSFVDSLCFSLYAQMQSFAFNRNSLTKASFKWIKVRRYARGCRAARRHGHVVRSCRAQCVHGWPNGFGNKGERGRWQQGLQLCALALRTPDCVIQFGNTSSAASLAIMQPLGRGGYGMVYAAQKIDTGKLYAVKCMGERVVVDSRRGDRVLQIYARGAAAYDVIGVVP